MDPRIQGTVLAAIMMERGFLLALEHRLAELADGANPAGQVEAAERLHRADMFEMLTVAQRCDVEQILRRRRPTGGRQTQSVQVVRPQRQRS